MERYNPARSRVPLPLTPPAAARIYREHVDPTSSAPLHPTVESTPSAHNNRCTLAEPSSGGEASAQPVYATTLGTLSFEELYTRTRKYAAFVLHTTYEVNPAAVDDGLQAGYLHLWQRLQAQPDLLHDKSLAWIVKGVAYRALHASRGDWQFQRHTTDKNPDSDHHSTQSVQVRMGTHSRESRQTDTRIDIHAAIVDTAQAILADQTGKRQHYQLWALYGLTMLQVCAADISRLFSVREQSMQQAYKQVRELLQQRLQRYAPHGATTPIHGRGQKSRPRQDVTAIRKANGNVSGVIYDAVKIKIERTQADTIHQDLLALSGIEQGIGAQAMARTHGIHPARMQRAYTRVHLMIGAQRDPSIQPRRPEKRTKSLFTLTDTTAAAVHQLALELLQQPKSYEKLVALHAHINNLAISTTAKHFNVPTSTLRFYAQRIKVRLGTPTLPMRPPE